MDSKSLAVTKLIDADELREIVGKQKEKYLTEFSSAMKKLFDYCLNKTLDKAGAIKERDTIKEFLVAAHRSNLDFPLPTVDLNVQKLNGLVEQFRLMLAEVERLVGAKFPKEF
jgi:hypothetical protein